MKILSKINYPKVIWSVVSVCFFWSGFTQLANMILREYNFRFIGRGENLELVSKCTLSSNLTARAYIYHSSGGATTSDSTSVYIQEAKSLFERNVWSAYSSPLISEMKCDEDNLIINTDYYLPELRDFQFSSEQLTNDLVEHPIHLYKGKDWSQSKPEWAIQGEKDFSRYISFCTSVLFILAFVTGYKAVVIKQHSES